jgi:hypothetical protein
MIVISRKYALGAIAIFVCLLLYMSPKFGGEAKK